MVSYILTSFFPKCQTEFIKSTSFNARRCQKVTIIFNGRQINILGFVHLNEEGCSYCIGVFVRIALRITVIHMVINLNLGLCRQIVQLTILQRTVTHTIPSAVFLRSAVRTRGTIYITSISIYIGLTLKEEGIPCLGLLQRNGIKPIRF